MPYHATIREIRAEVHGIGGYRILTTVADLADCLIHRWPVAEGEAYFRALRACGSMLSDGISAETARAAFVEAAREADIGVLPDDAP